MSHTSTIRVESGALDNVPLTALLKFLCEHGLELVSEPGGLCVRRKSRSGE